MNITPQSYGEMSRQASPRSNVKADTAMAFVTGGAICAFGQLIYAFLTAALVPDSDAKTWTSIILVILSAVATGFGWYQKLARHAGAGTLVPITGFSNAVSSSAIEAKSEGFILGVGAKIFTIAGPVILYGCAASAVYGLLLWIGSNV
ncbi:MAG: SpoVA/SpoVAEb family sporulation membrane protein [Ruminococcus sp.]|nr:SpoVA/SpoVAEb family sporulation membrane protein [Ruminococcus sp.]